MNKWVRHTISYGLTNHWTNCIFHTISKNIAIPLELFLDLAILNLEIDTISVLSRTEVINILLTARLVLMRQWKSPSPPAVPEVLALVYLHSTYETTFAYTNGSSSITTLGINLRQTGMRTTRNMLITLLHM